jgi:adenosylcobinamide-GDP ribazoletransferase
VSGLGGAVSLLTRLPVRAARGADALARAVPWFPVVGAGVGIGIALAFVAGAQLLPPLVAAAAATAAGAIATGALHEDGLGDLADALGAGGDRRRRLEILDDPRQGTFGVLALGIALVVRVGCIATLDAYSALALLPSAHALSRGAAIVLLRRLPVASGGGLGASYAGSVTAAQEAGGILAAVALAAALVGRWVAPAVVVCGAAAAVVGAVARRHLGGIGGDVLGATQQVAELAVLTLGAAVVHEGWPPLAWWAPL